MGKWPFEYQSILFRNRQSCPYHISRLFISGVLRNNELAADVPQLARLLRLWGLHQYQLSFLQHDWDNDKQINVFIELQPKGLVADTVGDIGNRHFVIGCHLRWPAHSQSKMAISWICRFRRVLCWRHIQFIHKSRNHLADLEKRRRHQHELEHCPWTCDACISHKWSRHWIFELR